MWHKTGLDQTDALELRAGPVFVAASPDDADAAEALIIRAALAGGHRSVRAARVLNGWVFAAVDE